MNRPANGSPRSARDDGGGAGPTAEAASGHGLLVMRERTELLGGVFQAGPHGAGWLLCATLPQSSVPVEAGS